MSSDLKQRVKKAGQMPGTFIYTGSKTKSAPTVTILSYDKTQSNESTNNTFDEKLIPCTKDNVTWVHVEGLRDVELISKIAKHYDLHPLTTEDILNVSQRSKVEDFDNYIFITMKVFSWDKNLSKVLPEQLSIIIGEDFVLSFMESKTAIFDLIRERLKSGYRQPLVENKSDYLAYRLMDSTIDQYFVVIEKLNNQIENIEELITLNPNTKNARELYHLKHKLLLLHKSIWPIRSEISHLIQADHKFITPATTLYLRDLYDHVVQAVDIIENLRDILSSVFEVYLSLVTNKLNEVMKVLTIISTLFIPITFVTSLYGMNFKYMPELQWRFGYPVTLAVMVLISCGMLFYFRRKKWI